MLCHKYNIRNYFLGVVFLVKKKGKSIIPIVLGVGALVLLSSPTAESLSGGGSFFGNPFGNPVDLSGLRSQPIGTGSSTPSFNVPDFSFPTQTEQLQIKKSISQSDADKMVNIVSGNGFTFGGGKSSNSGYTGSYNSNQFIVPTTGKDGFTGYGSIVGFTPKKSKSSNLVGLGNSNTVGTTGLTKKQIGLKSNATGYLRVTPSGNVERVSI